MRYPDLKTYEILYARFLQGNRTEQMLDLAGDINDKVLMDICCGGCRITKEALKRGAKRIIAIDSEVHMIPKDLKDEKVEIYRESIEEYLTSKGHNLNNCEWMCHKTNTIHHG